MPTQVRSEGITERVGDLVLTCTALSAGANYSGNITVFLPVGITNRVDASNVAQGAALTISPGSASFSGVVSNQSITFNAVSFTAPAGGAVTLRISNLRAAMNQFGAPPPGGVIADLSSNFLLLNQSRLPVAYAQPGLLATIYDRGITCTGSPLPSSTITLASLFATGTQFASTRVTEGFASAFQPRDASSDTGTRFILQYSGFPSGTRIFVPDFVAGSSALQPTIAGDLGGQQSVGQYVPGSGTLLLARVPYADSTGAGGAPVQLPGTPGVQQLNSVSEITLTGGAGYAVYEVLDANSGVQESAQVPTFIGISRITTATASETVSLAPVSTVTAASTTAPIPRFVAARPASDCTAVGDCGASYFPKLYVLAQPIQFSAFAGGAAMQGQAFIPVRNDGGGIISWGATVVYQNGSGWLLLDPPGALNNGTVRVTAQPQALAPGSYRANIVIDAGPAGTVSVPVTLTVQALPTPPQIPSTTPAPPTTPTSTPAPPAAPPISVTSVLNAASLLPGPAVSGSITTLIGANFAGKTVAVTFDGIPARILYADAGQINLVVPAALGTRASAMMTVTVDGVSSAAQYVELSPVWPAIFSKGILNQNNAVNAQSSGAAAGSVVQIFATGLPADGRNVTVKIHDRENLVPLYAGTPQGMDGLQQVNVAVPADLPAMQTYVSVCAAGQDGRQVCSLGAPLVIAQ